jgi:hypothetical protein
LRGAYAARFRDEVLGSSASIGDYLDRHDLARRFEIHRRGEADQSYVLWATWILERWLQTSARRSSGPPVAVEPLTVRPT